MIKFLNSIIDLKLAIYSAPSLIISLIGMLFTSFSFKAAVEHKKLKNFPFIFQSSAILGFKGNLELGYVIHLSTKRKLLQNLETFKAIALRNSCFLIFESSMIGLLVGSLSVLSMLLKNQVSLILTFGVMSSSLLTCFLSTLLFVLSFIFSLEMAIYLSIDPESFLMPILNTINDILVVRILYIYSLNLSSSSLSFLIALISAILFMSVVCLNYSYKTEDLIPSLSLETVSTTFFLNIVSGFLLDRFSSLYPMIAPAFPVFAGMTTSIAYIFLHKKFVEIECNEIMALNTKITLLLISLIISCSYIWISHLLKMSLSFWFSISFITMFSFQSLILLKIVDRMIKLLLASQKSISSNTVPIISSISDFMGAGILILTSYFGSLLK
jgi:solute carrier family 41